MAQALSRVSNSLPVHGPGIERQEPGLHRLHDQRAAREFVLDQQVEAPEERAIQ